MKKSPAPTKGLPKTRLTQVVFGLYYFDHAWIIAFENEEAAELYEYCLTYCGFGDRHGKDTYDMPRVDARNIMSTDVYKTWMEHDRWVVSRAYLQHIKHLMDTAKDEEYQYATLDVLSEDTLSNAFYETTDSDRVILSLAKS